jgi:hypothetical protein
MQLQFSKWHGQAVWASFHGGPGSCPAAQTTHAAPCINTHTSRVNTHLCQVVLDDVPNDAVVVEVAATPLCAKVLLEDDLHVAHIVPVPPGTKQWVGKPDDQHVLRGQDSGEGWDSRRGRGGARALSGQVVGCVC